MMRAKNSIYHTECFRCVVCDRVLSSGDEFCIREKGIYCKVDIDTADKQDSEFNNNNNNNNSNNNDSQKTETASDETKGLLFFTNQNALIVITRFKTLVFSVSELNFGFARFKEVLFATFRLLRRRLHGSRQQQNFQRKVTITFRIQVQLD